MSGEGGTAKASKTQVGHNEQVTLTATPNEDYSFVNWTVNGVEVSTSATYTATITSDTELNANFIKNKENGHVYVDLGLSVKWATCNVGASTPTNSGKYYPWSYTYEMDYNSDCFYVSFRYETWEIEQLLEFDENGNYIGFIGYQTNVYKSLLPLNLIKSQDAASVNWGGSWRMPTKEECEELLENCTWNWTTQNGVNGYKVTSKKNGNSIFLPAAGYYYVNPDGFGCGHEWSKQTGEVNLWSRTSTGSAVYYINNNSYINKSSTTTSALPIRPVCE